MDFEAITESGATYSRVDGRLNYDHRGKPQYFHNGHMKSVSVQAFEVMQKTGRIDWEYLRSLPDVDLPVLGECLYVYTMKEWRISTPIVRVTTVTEPEEEND